MAAGSPVGRARWGFRAWSQSGVAAVVDGAVVLGAGVGDVCMLVQAVSVSKLTQTRSTRFMTIRSPRRCASPTTNADPARVEPPGLHQSIDAPRSNEPGRAGSPQPAAVFSSIVERL